MADHGMPSQEDTQALVMTGPDPSLAEILAIQNRMQRYNPKREAPQRGTSGKFVPRQDPAAGATQSAKAPNMLKCPNGGGEHYASESKEARRDLKPGHIAREC